MRLHKVIPAALPYLTLVLLAYGGIDGARVESERSFSMEVQEFVNLCENVSKTQKGWVARCPAHDDKNPSLSIGVGHDERILLDCFAGCRNEDIVAALGLQMRDLFPDSKARSGGSSKRGGGASNSRKGVEHSNTAEKGLTLKEYAKAKRIPPDFLEKLRIRELYYLSRLALRIPYLGIDGNEVSVRFRLELTKSEQTDDRFRWKKGAKPCLYGLWKLGMVRQAGYIILVEGESDCHTLWFHDYPAVGVPGATNWKEERDASYFDGLQTIYVVIEPDRGGQAVLDWLSTSRIRDRVRIVQLGDHKDPSALYLADPENFKQAWQAALDAAEPWAERIKGEQQSKADKAYEMANPLLNDPQLMDRIGQIMRAQGYAGDLAAPLLAYTAITSRFLERPLNVAFVAPSSAGKNRAVDAAVNLVPPEAVYLERAGSARALIYADESFEHRTVIVAEADSIPEDGPAASAVRSLAADNEMAYDVVEKNPQTNRFETRHIINRGPTGFITTSTRSLGHQMNTRVLEIPLRDDPEQTREIMRAHARNVVPFAKPVLNVGAFIALQEWLALRGVHDVTIPFAEVLANLVPAKNVRMRRDFKQLLTSIQAIALLYQCQRQLNSEEQVEATIADYEMARKLLSPIFETLASEGLSRAIRETIEAIAPDEEVTEAMLTQRLGLSKATVSYRVKRAISGGWLVNKETRKGYPAKLERGAPLPETVPALPEPEQLKEVFECSNRLGQESTPPPPSCGTGGEDTGRADREVDFYDCGESS